MFHLTLCCGCKGHGLITFSPQTAGFTTIAAILGAGGGGMSHSTWRAWDSGGLRQWGLLPVGEQGVGACIPLPVRLCKQRQRHQPRRMGTGAVWMYVSGTISWFQL